MGDPEYWSATDDAIWDYKTRLHGAIEAVEEVLRELKQIDLERDPVDVIDEEVGKALQEYLDDEHLLYVSGKPGMIKIMLHDDISREIQLSDLVDEIIDEWTGYPKDKLEEWAKHFEDAARTIRDTIGSMPDD